MITVVLSRFTSFSIRSHRILIRTSACTSCNLNSSQVKKRNRPQMRAEISSNKISQKPGKEKKKRETHNTGIPLVGAHVDFSWSEIYQKFRDCRSPSPRSSAPSILTFGERVGQIRLDIARVNTAMTGTFVLRSADEPESSSPRERARARESRHAGRRAGKLFNFLSPRADLAPGMAAG